MIDKVQKQAIQIGRELELSGFLNIQMALFQNEIFVLEVNPRASRTLPFVCKATGGDWVRAGVLGMLGSSFKSQGLEAPPIHPAAF